MFGPKPPDLVVATNKQRTLRNSLTITQHDLALPDLSDINCLQNKTGNTTADTGAKCSTLPKNFQVPFFFFSRNQAEEVEKAGVALS